MRGGASTRETVATLLLAAVLLVAPTAADASVGNFGMVVQPNGKIIVAGGGANGQEAGVVVRYLRNGRLDRRFGKEGLVIAPSLKPFTAVALQPDGRILLTSPVGELSRLLPNGEFDGSFGVGGIGPPGSLSAYYPTTVRATPDRSILVGGMTGYLNDPGEQWYGRLYRYTPDGRSSEWVGSMTTGDGRAGEPKSFLNDIVVGAHGVVYGAGTVAPREPDARSRAGLVQLLPGPIENQYPAGPDPSFGGGVGLVESNFFPSSGLSESANAMARDHGKLLIAGEADGRFLLARYTSGGMLDTRFGSGGAAVTNIHGRAVDSANAIVVQRSGKIVLAGTSGYGCQRVGCSSMALARYKPNGKLDRRFGAGGIVSPRVGATYGRPPTEIAYGLANQPRGGLLVGGLLFAHGKTRFVLRRYLADGKPDRTFGDHGIVTTLP
jgi:uncharacterized delta-60 repeat protein